ncbi:UNVERIFIED_CONTAM: hypothetical protein PYX00_003635 [Menopon gallinae]|uniref:Uncharacterized protein n=1 Tax=Menopon gallinae TaxID=328185 RepID=A0AAW2I0M2_9NEOP
MGGGKKRIGLKQPTAKPARGQSQKSPARHSASEQTSPTSPVVSRRPTSLQTNVSSGYESEYQGSDVSWGWTAAEVIWKWQNNNLKTKKVSSGRVRSGHKSFAAISTATARPLIKRIIVAAPRKYANSSLIAFHDRGRGKICRETEPRVGHDDHTYRCRKHHDGCLMECSKGVEKSVSRGSFDRMGKIGQSPEAILNH